MVLETMRHCRLFDLLTEEQLVLISQLATEHYFHKGEYVCREGSWGDSMYVIDSGEVKVTKKLDVEDVWEITVLRHGDCFGEVSLIDGSTRTASVVALSNTCVLEIISRDFRQLIDRGDDLSFRLYESLTRMMINRIRATDDMVAKIMVDMKPGRAREAATMRDAITRLIVSR